MRRVQREKGFQREGGIQGPFQEMEGEVKGVPEFSPAQRSFWEVAGSSRP